MSTTPETLCCVGARSVAEVTREVIILAGKDKGKHTLERVYYLSTLEMRPEEAGALLSRIREYWGIENGLHHRLDVTAGEDSSRVRNRNALLVLGIVRRSTVGWFLRWRRARKNKRQSTLRDFYDAMSAFNNRAAFASLKPHAA